MEKGITTVIVCVHTYFPVFYVDGSHQAVSGLVVSPTAHMLKRKLASIALGATTMFPNVKARVQVDAG